MKTEILSDIDLVAVEEYFEREVDFKLEHGRPKELKHEFLSLENENDEEGMEEYFEKDVKHTVESYDELD